MITIEELKNKAEPNFYIPVLSEFHFLEDEYGFVVNGSATSCETTIVYSKGNTGICILHAFPEAPSLFIRKTISGKIVKEKSPPKPTLPDVEHALKMLNRMRDELDIDEWCKKFRDGDFNSSIAKLINYYASFVKGNIDKIRADNS